jgi:hypothetical protein
MMGRHIDRGANTAAEWLRQVYETREHANVERAGATGNA